MYIIHVRFWQNYFIGKDRSSPVIIVKIKNVAFATFLFWCPKWDYTTRVGKIIYKIIFTFVSAGTRPARNSATSFSSPTVIVKIKKCSYCYIFFSGAQSGTRTHMVSRMILSHVRLPIPPHRHLQIIY